MKLKLKANKLTYSGLFNNINFTAEEGKLTVISGEKHSGKSTLLSILSGLINPTSGSVYINGKSIYDSPYNIGYIYDPVHIEGIDRQSIHPYNNSDYDYNFIIINHKLETYGYISFSPTSNKTSFLTNSIINIPEIILIDDLFSTQSNYYKSIYQDIYRLTKQKNKICIMAVSGKGLNNNSYDKIIYLNK